MGNKFVNDLKKYNSIIVVEENVINEGVDPLLIYEDAPRLARGKASKG